MVRPWPSLDLLWGQRWSLHLKWEVVWFPAAQSLTFMFLWAAQLLPGPQLTSQLLIERTSETNQSPDRSGVSVSTSSVSTSSGSYLRPGPPWNTAQLREHLPRQQPNGGWQQRACGAAESCKRLAAASQDPWKLVFSEAGTSCPAVHMHSGPGRLRFGYSQFKHLGCHPNEVTRKQTLFWVHENTAAVAGLPLKWAKMGEKEKRERIIM